MATLKQKRKRNLVLLLVVLVAVVGIYIGASVFKAKKEESAKGIILARIAPEDIEQITYRRTGEDPVELKKEQDVWVNKNTPDAVLEQKKVTEILNGLTEVIAKKKVEDADISQFGLADPRLVLEVTLKKGKTVRINYGDENPADLGCYGTFGDDDTLYLMDKGLYESVNRSPGQLTTVETLPQFDEDNVTALSWHQKGDIVLELEKNDSADQLFNMWSIEAPYAGTVYADTLKLGLFFGRLNKIVFSECVAYDCKDFSKYGFDDPELVLTLDYMENGEKKSFTIEFGGEDENHYYYVKTSLSNNVNTFNDTDASAFLKMDPYTYVSKALYGGNLAGVSGYRLDYNGKTYDLKAEIKDDDEADYYLNGKKISLEKFDSVRNQVLNLKIDSEMKKKVEDEDPILHITIVLDGGAQMNWSFLPYDDHSFYTLEIDGNRSFVVTKKSIDSIIKALQEL
ncbi:DUF4340 domain-containing protein [Anaerolentibacter hominis]|uniref:DUF4340 domain-containing protein n=1 Tax=Anaerolentibacter hominis TaxID=3079009 RepID=UPI0031B7F297